MTSRLEQDAWIESLTAEIKDEKTVLRVRAGLMFLHEHSLHHKEGMEFHGLDEEGSGLLQTIGKGQTLDYQKIVEEMIKQHGDLLPHLLNKS